MTKHLWIAAVMSALLAACASVPESVQGPADPNITLATVRGNDAAVNGQLVRWGGLVARVQNKDNQSWIEIVEQPLGSSGRPVGGNVTGGRFIAIFGGFLDPLIFKTGSEITVVGSLQPGVEGKIDDQPYKFPVLSGSGYHLWEPRADRHYDDVLLLRGSYWDPFWYRPYYPVIIHHYHPAPTPRGAGTGSSTSTGHGGAGPGAGPGAGNTSTTSSATPAVTDPRRPPIVRAESPRQPVAERENKPKRRDDKER